MYFCVIYGKSMFLNISVSFFEIKRTKEKCELMFLSSLFDTFSLISIFFHSLKSRSSDWRSWIMFYMLFGMQHVIIPICKYYNCGVSFYSLFCFFFILYQLSASEKRSHCEDALFRCKQVMFDVVILYLCCVVCVFIKSASARMSDDTG